jgi:beta-glucanase (GH16 family)
MRLSRSALKTIAAIALTSAPLAAAVAVWPAAATAAPLHVNAAPSAVRHNRVASAGNYEVRVNVTTPITASTRSSGHVVHIEIGRVSRRVTTGHRGNATLRERLFVKKGTLTIRANARRARPGLTVSMYRIKPSTRASTGSSGATGTTGTTGTTATTTATTVSPPADVAGGSGLMLPPGFLPVANYTSLVKDYEFDGSGLPADWSAGNDTTHGFAGTIFNASQVSLTGSSVALSVTNQPADGYAYQSGWISTEGSFSLTHGLIDFRAKMPAGQGLWSGLWLDQPDGSNPWGEIDVQEMLLADTHTVYGSLHGWAPSQWGETQSTSITADASTGFHDYELVWQPGLLTWAVDGVAFAQYTQAQAQAAGYPWVADDGAGYYLIADLAAGSNVWGGPPNTSTPFPSSMQLQSVKIWQ